MVAEVAIAASPVATLALDPSQSSILIIYNRVIDNHDSCDQLLQLH